MNQFCVEGNKKLNGNVIISGSKNAALPILFMSILTNHKVKISNVPKLTDIDLAIQLLKYIGAEIKHQKCILIDPKPIKLICPPQNLISKIRGSIWMLAPLLTRFNQAKIFFPGGCQIGKRPIDLHLKGLKKLGATIRIKKNSIQAFITKRMKGTHILMEKISVGATVTIISAAVLAEGLTVIENAAREPEIVDIAKFLNTLGANITGAGNKKIFIKGVSKLNGGKHKVIPDRIETGTFLVAAAISKGRVICKKTEPKHLKQVLKKLSDSGAIIKFGKNWISLDMRGKRPHSVDISTAAYPGFPTDLLAQFTLLNSISKGKSKITETIFENRFMHVPQLIKMGANITTTQEKNIICCGVPKLFSKNVFSTDLRTSATLILAGCIAEGITQVHKIFHLFRGYEYFSKKLNLIGANIKRNNKK
ncbi:UDP-N-acetylglucosamine 1-carboxyvinyltransferase [Buchnera aphidicola (Muscaphis stroyani)]|uniref:UDP-N-acetylglucosamine 1-carboxyvinyltransferase n=1 Tax=Buchnera aphidicola (Muscaphis stroyani) TaxID=1241869 RepID=A0A4D6Y4U3_9GAMM|nr:UDP-N-acetylglucosamine 1-carboxyvinyltransferase [Buchnera aphidicola]QCI24442.1 UDP-N-acetylglucosamine 1-carboxyvinyltransferase [Buchnera aphidicola (Muscaphis stroyani)]